MYVGGERAHEPSPEKAGPSKTANALSQRTSNDSSGEITQSDQASGPSSRTASGKLQSGGPETLPVVPWLHLRGLDG